MNKYDDGYGETENNMPPEDPNQFDKDPNEGRIIYGVNHFNNTFSSEEILESYQFCTQKLKKTDLFKSIIEQFKYDRGWSVQCWQKTTQESIESLWPSHTYNGLTYQQAIDKKREILAEGNSLNSVEIIVRVND